MLTTSTSGPESRRGSLFTALLLLLALAAILPQVAAGATPSAQGTPDDGPDAGPDSGALLARAKEAAGGDAWDRVRVIQSEATVSTGGLEGTLVSWEEITTGRAVSRYDLGVVTGAEGWDGERPWSQSDSGDVAVRGSQGDLEGARDAAYVTARGYFHPERWPAEVRYLRREEGAGGEVFQVLEVVPEEGRPMELWLDAETLLLARTVEEGATDVTTTFFSDYREVDGLLLPFRLRSSTGDPAYDTVLEVTAVAIDPEVPEGTFEMPASDVRDFRLPEGRQSIVLPFELLNNHIYVTASVGDGEPGRFLVDTGGVNLLTVRAADEMGIERQGSFEASGVGSETVDAGLARIDLFTLGEGAETVRFEDTTFVILPLDGVVQAEGVDFAGLVGFEVFRRFVVEIDYARHRITLTLPEAFRYEGDGTRVPFELDDRIPVVEGAIDGLSGTFSIDTGSRSTVDLHAPFAREHGLASAYVPAVEAVSGWGVGGSVRSLVSRGGLLELGDADVPGPLVEIAQVERGAYTDRYTAGNVGGGVLKRFTVIFDYAHQEMILEPNHLFDDPDPFDRSGMWINRDGEGFRIEDVVAGGPAEEAGLRVGERIVVVDGAEAGRLRLPDLRRRLRESPPGTVVELEVVGAHGARRSVHLVLRELV